MNNLPRDCNHPEFPLRKRCRTHRGKPYAEWVRKIRKKRICFGACSNDPTGALAWRLYEAERSAWQAGRNPREGYQRLSFARALALRPGWLLTGPLSKIGVAVVDPCAGRLVCMTCHATWRVKFSDLADISPRRLKCPRGCARSPLREVREAVTHTLNPDAIPWQYLEALEKARKEGWQAAPQNIDLEAEVEGKAIRDFAAKFRMRQPRRQLARCLNRAAISRATPRASPA